MLGTQEERTKGMKRQAQELIDQAYQRGLKAGVESCIDSLTADIERYIEKGRNEAWEALKRICCYGKGCLSGSELEEIFGTSNDSDIILHNTASEAIEKIKAYEEQKQEDSEIHIGDEVAFPDGYKFIVGGLEMGGCTFDGLYVNGNGVDTGLDKSRVTKTGRTFPEIVEVLKKIQEGK